MTFITRPKIAKQFDTIHDFGITNLVVSGASFTHNNHESSAVTWPYYLRDLGGFSQVFDCSLPGAGNGHVSRSLQWSLEVNQISADDSLVIVMWAPNDNDDYVWPTSNIRQDYPFRFSYSASAMTGFSGGSLKECTGNMTGNAKQHAFDSSFECRAIENYLQILSLYNYLKVNNFRFVFLHPYDYDLPVPICSYDIRKYLPTKAQTKLDEMFTKTVTIFEYAIKNDLLYIDDAHPSPDGHLGWTKNILFPKVKQLFG